MEKKFDIYRFAVIAFLIIVFGIVLLPFLWLVVSSLKPGEELFTRIPRWFTKSITLGNYIWVLGPTSTSNLLKLLLNSVVVSSMTAFMTVVFAAVAGYSIARFKFRGAVFVIIILVFSQMFQGPLIMIPWYKMASQFKILNTKLVLMLIYGTSTIPIGVWLMSGFYKNIPFELEESAYIDGCGKLKTLFSIIIPVVKPAFVSIFIYSFIQSWNDYQYALILTNSTKAATVQIGIAQMLENLGANVWGGILASGVIATLPAVILFAVIQKYLIQGLTAGALKG